jgi:hypothetical protein
MTQSEVEKILNLNTDDNKVDTENIESLTENNVTDSEHIVTFVKNNKTNSSDQLFSNGCCCTESESHFYYFTAKFQNTEKLENSKSTVQIDLASHRPQFPQFDFGHFHNCSNKFLTQHRLRKKVPPSLLVQYDVWVI